MASIVLATCRSIASRWKELSGEKNWEDLLDPLDLDLRRYIIHYGQRAAAVGDIFNDEDRLCPCPKEKVFSTACLEKGNKFKYDVTHFFYAGSAEVEPAWFGYVAVSATTDKGKDCLGRRDILIAWRGTITETEWLNDTNINRISASELFGTGTNANVHAGFLSLYTGTRSDCVYTKTSAREQVLDAVRELVNKYQNEEISITVAGFSLGAALATLNAMDIVANGYNKPTGNLTKSVMVTAFVYGGPRVGDTGLNEVFKTLGHHLHLLRTTNYNDPVPKILKGLYKHLGSELKIDTSRSKYLKWRWFGNYPVLPDGSTQEEITGTTLISTQEKITSTTLTTVNGGDYVSAHNMDVYLHGIAGVQKDEFRLVVDHDIALVNRHLDRLEDKYNIPTHWWKGENRHKMVQMEDGHWKVVGRRFYMYCMNKQP
ncbi:hypothetical protein DITRI_Ditri09bG0070400 [Diplodiscus trichospermus]